MVSAQLAQVIPSTFHCTFSMLQILLQIYPFQEGGYATAKNILTTPLLSTVKFAYGNNLFAETIATNCQSVLEHDLPCRGHRISRKHGRRQNYFHTRTLCRTRR